MDGPWRPGTLATSESDRCASTGANSGATGREDDQMFKSISIAAGALALCVAGAVMLALPGQRAAAQSAGMFVNAVDLDVVPAERENFLSGIKENRGAGAKEPGCPRVRHTNPANESA